MSDVVVMLLGGFMKNRTKYLVALLVLAVIFVYIVGISDYIRTVFTLLNDWHTSNHIVVIESDDWGKSGLNKNALKELERNSIFSNEISNFLKSGNSNDALESPDNMEKLYNLLEKHKDSRGGIRYLQQIWF